MITFAGNQTLNTAELADRGHFFDTKAPAASAVAFASGAAVVAASYAAGQLVG